MSLKSNNTQPAAAAAQPADNSNNNPAGLMSLRQRFGGAVPRTTAGETVKKFAETFRKVIEESGEDYRVIIMDSAVYNTVLSAIVVTGIAQGAGGRQFVAAHTLIVEASGPKPGNLTVNIGGNTIELLSTAGDVANDAMWEKVKQAVAQSYGGTMVVCDAGASVIPKELTNEERDVDNVVRVLAGAAEAVYQTLLKESGHEPDRFCVDQISRSDRVTARLDYNPSGVLTSAGLPIRSDIAIDVVGSAGGNNADPFANNQVEITSTDGFLDLLYVKPPQVGMGVPPVTQHFMPRYIITNLESRLGAVTMELFLFALHSAQLLSKNMAWAAAFRPRLGSDAALRDIGAVALEVPGLTEAGRKIDTQTAAFDIQKLYELLTVTVHPNVIYAMDVEERGENSWMTLAFIAAAQNDPTAYQLIVDAANRLTNNRFSQVFKGGQIVLDDCNRIHLGYYIDAKTNQRRDIRTVDYLAMLNYVGETDMGVVVEFDRTYSDVDRPLELRLKRRHELLQQVLGETMRVTGYARRITFNPMFLEALAQAIQGSGFSIQPGNLQFDYGVNTRRGFDMFNAMAFNSAHMGGMFNPNLPQGGNTYNNVGFRWGRR